MDLAALRVKYLELRSLRSAPGGEDVRPRLRALAADFPGALRELDEIPLEVIDARIQALDRVADGAAPELWMLVTARFHELTRSALSAKRLLSHRATDEPSHAELTINARAWVDQMDEIAEPPRGRLSELVIRRVAREHDLTIPRTLELVRAHSRVRR
mgnify:CR=1 FL=1